MSGPRSSLSKQGHYAGAISRLLAFAADIGIAWVLALIGFWLISAAGALITGRLAHLSKVHLIGLILLCCWYPIYFAYQWSLSGKTLGMAIFGLRVVSAEGRALDTRHAIIRTLMLPVSIAVFGLGLFGIVLRLDHRGWHDQAARTCVVYDWDARAAHLRWLANKNEFLAARTRPTDNN